MSSSIFCKARSSLARRVAPATLLEASKFSQAIEQPLRSALPLTRYLHTQIPANEPSNCTRRPQRRPEAMTRLRRLPGYGTKAHNGRYELDNSRIRPVARWRHCREQRADTTNTSHCKERFHPVWAGLLGAILIVESLNPNSRPMYTSTERLFDWLGLNRSNEHEAQEDHTKSNSFHHCLSGLPHCAYCDEHIIPVDNGARSIRDGRESDESVAKDASEGHEAATPTDKAGSGLPSLSTIRLRWVYWPTSED